MSSAPRSIKNTSTTSDDFAHQQPYELSATMAELPTEISIVTLNCWGLKYISKLRRERLLEIGRQLAIADPQPQIVALQECFCHEDYLTIRRETRYILPYGKFYFAGAFGGGLAILSKWPIEESTMFRYPLNGRPTAFWRGDWYVGKGVACAKIRYGPGPKHIIEVFNTHTHAPYESGPKDSYICHRTSQSWEISKLLRGAAERGHLVLGLGDFNMLPLSLEHQIVTSHAPVRDVWRILHPDSSVGPAHHHAEKARGRPVPTAEFNILENCATSDGPFNTWRWLPKQQKRLGIGKPEVTVDPSTPDLRGKRLDYIFAGAGDVVANGGGWVVKRAAVGMMMRHPELGCSLSDHFAVEATLKFVPLKQQHNNNNSPFSDTHQTIKPTTTLLNDPDNHLIQTGTYLQEPSSQGTSIAEADANTETDDNLSYTKQLLTFNSPPPRLPPSGYDQILSLIHKYVARERSQLKWRAYHFFAWLGVSIGCLVAVWFVPRNFVAFILMLVSTLGLVGGTLDGLMSLLFFRSELRALKEYEFEILTAKALAEGKTPVVQQAGTEEDVDAGKQW
ncbi:DNase I-like protein [Neurospora tetraspora]|uniref:DNase I-like protein n=1 Tax=Neurospora tetraspora TaxID=94610 RepID=A0AAE0JNN2_9PEZI|nr:DNase I-like protein [Neurospora tetraspora]